MNTSIRNKALTFLILAAALFLSGVSVEAATINHDYAIWGELLQAYTQDGVVDYQALKESPEDLTRVPESFRSATPDQYKGWSRNQKIAFWLNVYNYAAMKLVVDNYPIQKRLGWKALAYPDNSIQQIPDVWDRNVIRVMGKDRSLNEIEHEILRKKFAEPRIHFALVCASIGCPKLHGEPYVADRLEEQLDDQVRTFMSNPKKARYERESDMLYLSPILKWFGDDFKAIGGRIAFVRKYLPGEVAAYLSDKTEIKWLDYDWSLNEGEVKP